MRNIIFTNIVSDKELDLYDLTLQYADNSWKKYNIVAIVTDGLEQQTIDLFYKHGFIAEAVAYSDVINHWINKYPTCKGHVLSTYRNHVLLATWFVLSHNKYDKVFKIESDCVMCGNAENIFKSQICLAKKYLAGGCKKLYYENSDKVISHHKELFKLFDEELSPHNWNKYFDNIVCGSPILFVQNAFNFDKYEQALLHLDQSLYWETYINTFDKWHANYLDEKLFAMAMSYSSYYSSPYLAVNYGKPEKFTDSICNSLKRKSCVHLSNTHHKIEAVKRVFDNV